ncbi:U4/U6 small nuclear ribonucleoprotein Prp31 [Perkinsus olseni]|uniref:U4/U6 small nuclear ribonucleoprotein Prp31 n=1 Tax=Perkinsus olseni TaxID=32597 RepID=A0A7J6P7T2_PEROL|nr:U4/U6 small nuclear ribonucleoprotein Prp31 [Perkinsus olseni]
MSLADSFLADLDDVLDVRTSAEDTEDDKAKIVEGGDEEDEEKLPVEGDEKEEDEPSVGVSQLLADEDFLSTMQRIRDASSAMESGEEDEEMKDGGDTAGASAEAGSLEDTAGTKKAEYELLSKCNTVAVTIDEDIYHIHRYVKKVVYWPVAGVLLADGGSVGLALVYSKKFPELESIVSMPLDYMRVVQRLIEKEEAGVFGNASGPNATLGHVQGGSLRSAA